MTRCGRSNRGCWPNLGRAHWLPQRVVFESRAWRFQIVANGVV